MSEGRSTPRPSKQENKRNAPEESLPESFDNFSPFDKHCTDDPDQSERKWPGPKPRFSYLLLGPEGGDNVPRTLNSREANPINPLLHLNDTFEARVVLDCPRFTDYSMRFQVFDKDNRMYDMKLLQGFVRGSIEFVFNAEWRRFVRYHNLKAGDEISFDKYLDTNISDDFYYNLKYVRKSPDGNDDALQSSEKPRDDVDRKESKDKQKEPEASELKMPVFKVTYHRVLLEKSLDQEEKNSPGPGSRDFPLEASCLSKTLTAPEVVRGDGAMLYFDVYDAIILTDCPKIAQVPPGDCSKEFLVFDVDNRRYDMKLEHYMHRGGIFRYCLVGWETFLGNHNLKDGDQVTFYKFLDKSVSKDYYYVLKYVVKQPADVDRNRKHPERPGYRACFPANHCFTKTLSPNKVPQGNAGLHLDAFQARYVDSPGRNLNDLMVFNDSQGGTDGDSTLQETNIIAPNAVIYGDGCVSAPLFHAFKFLPYRQRYLCKSVCKGWRKALDKITKGDDDHIERRLAAQLVEEMLPGQSLKEALKGREKDKFGFRAYRFMWEMLNFKTHFWTRERLEAVTYEHLR